MLLLGIDTATAATTVAVYDGARVIAEQTHVDARRHAEVLGPAMQSVLDRASRKPRELTAVAVGIGPGPYTGLRVGVATAAAFADALSVPSYGICTLDVLARQTEQAGPVTVVTDARRREVFWASYDEAGTRIAGPSVSRPADVPVAGRAVGPGALLYADAFATVAGPEQVSAAALCLLVAERLTSGLPLEPVRPMYLRRPDTAAPQPAKPVLQR